MREASTGTPAATASEMTFAPPSLSDDSTMAPARPSRRRTSARGRSPRQTYADWPHLGPRPRGPLRRQGPKIHDAHPRGRRQAAHRLGRAQRILHLAQMPDHRDIEASRRRAMRRTQRRSRLVHDANLGPKSCRHSPPRKLLQRDQAVGARERMQSRHRIAIDIVVDVGAAQRDDKRPIRITLAKIAGCCRRCATRGARSSDPRPFHCTRPAT